MNIIKVALVGLSGVGKSSFTTLLNTGEIDNVKDYDKCYYKTDDKEDITIFKFVKEKEANVIFLMFDFSRDFTLNYIETFLNNNTTKPVIILGNKNDLDYDGEKIISKINEYIKKYSNVISFHDISVVSFSHITCPLDSAIANL